MKLVAVVTLAICACLMSNPAVAEAQILDKLIKKIEKKIDRKTDQVIDKADKAITDAAKNAAKSDSAKPPAAQREQALQQVPGQCLATPSPLEILVRNADGTVLKFTGDTASAAMEQVATGVASIASSGSLTLLLMRDGTIMQSKEKKPLVRVPDIENAVDIAAGRNHGVALLADGTVITWGEKTGGVPGDGTCPIRPCDVMTMSTETRKEMEERYPGCKCPQRTPGVRPPEFDFAKVTDITDGVAVAAGEWQTLVISRDGTVRSWGTNYWDDRRGVLGVDALFFVLSPKQLPGIAKAVSVSTGGGKGAAVLVDGSVKTWGAYQGRRISPREVEDAHTPVPAPALKNAVAITSEIILSADGSVALWSRPDGEVIQIKQMSPAVAIITDTGVFPAYAALLKDGRIIKWGGRRRFPKGPVEIGRVDAASAAACDARIRNDFVRRSWQ